MNHPANNNNEWYAENHRKREVYKKGRYLRNRDGKNSTGNSGSGKCLTLSSQMQSSLCTDYLMYQSGITKII